VRGGHEAWGGTVDVGGIPAHPADPRRPFLPESPVWKHEEAGRHVEATELRRALRPQLQKTTIVTTVMMAAAYAAAFGAIPTNAAHRARPV